MGKPAGLPDWSGCGLMVHRICSDYPTIGPKRQDLKRGDTPMAQERRMNLRFPPEMFDELDEKRFKARTSFQEIGFRLFEEWLTGKHPEPKPAPAKPLDPLLEKVEMIRTGGDAELFAIVKKAVEASYGILQHSLTAEEIEHLKAAANRDASVVGRHRGPGKGGEEPAGTGQKRTRKSA